MAAPSKRPSPVTQMRERLELAHAAEVPFDTAWVLAWTRIQWPHDTTHRRSWKRALASTREAWEAMYEGEPRRAEVAVSRLLVA
jgi:hypothetical protein